MGKSGDVEAPQLKVSLTDPPIFKGFVIGEASGDGRPMIGRQSADFLKIFSSWYRSKIARQSVDDILLRNRRQTDAGYRPLFGRWSPDCRPIITINHGLFMCYNIVNNACIHTNYDIYRAFILIWDSFHLTSCTSNIWCLCWICVGFPIELFVWHFEINISTKSKRLLPNSGHSLNERSPIHVDWTIRMKFWN